MTCAIIFLLGETAGALELEVQAGAGNMAFDAKSEKALITGSDGYNPTHFPLGHISMKGEYSDLIDYSFRIEQDPILRRRATGAVGLNFKFGRFEMGPLAGIMNTGELPLSAGVAGSLRLEYPGIIFGSLKASSTLASAMAMPGDHIQSEGEAALGFWVPNVICELSINVKNFTCLMTETLFSRDELIRYQFSADVHSKNVPYTIKIDMGYQELSRAYRPTGTATGNTETDELKSVFLGFEGTWRIIPKLRAVLGLEMPVYSWTTQPLKKDDPDTVFYEFRAGVILNF